MLSRTILFVLFLSVLLTSGIAQSLKSPEDMFGFKMGSDRKLINWSQITSYFQHVAKRSKRVKVLELGQTTLDRSMLMAIIGAEETISRLDKYRNIQEKLARPFSLQDYEAEALIQAGKLVVMITMNIHSTEVASSQESVELLYELATSNEASIRRLLDNLIILLIPSLNPDGQDMVTKWYLQDVGTPYEGSRMPQKYHYYADHDNNRDWFFFNLVESQHVAKVLYHDWYPEIVMDQHQMESDGPRMFLPPYADPVNPNVAPSIMANVNMLGQHVISDLQNSGFAGLVSGIRFNAYFEGTMSKTPLWHNRIGILLEVAGVQVATPLFFPKTSLRGMGIELPEYSQQTNFLDPWHGGWWHLRDIIEYEKAATYSLLGLAATYKNKFKENFYRLNKDAIEKQPPASPFAYILPRKQHDPHQVTELLKGLRFANVEIYEADTAFVTTAGSFSKGDWIVPLAQPARRYIKDLMERQEYPNLRDYPGGPPRQPYDMTAWTLPLLFDVQVYEITKPFYVKWTPVMKPVIDQVYVPLDSSWLGLDRRFMNSYMVVNSLLRSGVAVFEQRKKDVILPEGTLLFRLPQHEPDRFQKILKSNQMPVVQIADTVNVAEIEASRIAVYQPWLPWAYDEGWLRLVFDRFGFEYEVLNNKDFKSRVALRSKYDVLIFTSLAPDWIMHGKSKTAEEPEFGMPEIRKEFTGGIGKIGVDKVLGFLNDGGTVLFFGKAVDFAIEYLRLPAENVLGGLERSDYFAPGSLFRMFLNHDSKLVYGMQNTVAVYKNSAVALRLKPYNAAIKETGFLGTRNLLESGWVVGEEKLHGKVLLAEIPVGSGMAILYAFRPQHRAQTYGTFKLIFNALYQKKI